MAPVTLSVSQIRAAAVDPKWRQALVEGRNPSTQSFSPIGTPTVYGTRFHAVVRRFIDRLARAEVAFDASPDALFAQIYEGDAQTFLAEVLEAGEVESAAIFSDALHAFTHRLDQLRRRAPNARRWSDIFVAQEHRITDVKYQAGAHLVFISGIMDGIRHHPSGVLEVVDYKLTQGAELHKELIQVALYQYLLRQRDHGLRACACLEYFHPRLHTIDVTQHELETTFETLVAPVLEQIADAWFLSSTKSVPARRPSTGPLEDAPTERSVPAKSEPPGLSRTSEPVDHRKLAGANTDHRTKTLETRQDQPTVGVLSVGKTRSALAKPVELSVKALIRHTGILGGSGSGKTTLALNLLEQLIQQGVPVLLVDRKGDLCRYADPALADEPKLTRLYEKMRVALYTPGQPTGRPLSIGLVPPGIEELDATERAQSCRSSALGLASMLGLKTSPTDQARTAVLVKALQTFIESRPGQTPTLSGLIELVSGQDPDLVQALGALSTKHLDKLSDQLQTLQIMQGELFAQHDEMLSAERLFGFDQPADGKTQLSIVSTKFLGGEVTALFWVAQLLLELQRFASRSPQPHLQAVVMFDEADLYLPAVGKPVTKEPMESLLKRARSAGIGIMLLSQSPGDFDYKSRENIRTWFVGLVKQKPALEKLRPVMAESNIDAATVLPQQRVGEFFMISEKSATPIRSERSLVDTEQMSEQEILQLAQHQTR